MKTKWLIQTSGFKSNYIEETINTLHKLNISFDTFGVTKEKKISNLNEIVEDNTQYISRGGILMLDILNEANSLEYCSTYIDEDKNKIEYLNELRKSVDYSITGFDQNIYKDYKLPLLNSQAEYHLCSDILDTKFNSKMFIKPSRDLKFFNGGVMQENITIKEHIKSGYYKKGFEDEIIVISPIVNIYAEYRFFIIEDKVITGSLYKRGSKVEYSSLVPEYMLSKAKELAKEYKPADIFVMDLAETDNGIKIVEYNCWNCSGLYHADVPKLINAVNEFKLS